MKTRFLAIAALVCLSPLFNPLLFGQDVKSTVTSIEKSLWEAWKTHQIKPFEQFLTADTVNVTSQGLTAGKEAVIKDMTANPCEVRNYSLSDWQFHEVSSDTVILTYKAKQDATCRGSKVPAEVLATAVYVKKNGKWMAASYQETPMMNASTMKAE
jgi:hypothetical protein